MVGPRTIIDGAVRRVVRALGVDAVGARVSAESQSIRLLLDEQRLSNADTLRAVRDHLEELLRRVPSQTATPGLSEVMVDLADLSSDWSENYTKQADLAYVAENRRHHQPLFDLIEKLTQDVAHDHIPRALEVGMGLGTMCVALSLRNFDVTGMDFDPVLVARARRLGQELGGFARYLGLDVLDLTLFQPNCWDIAFSQGTMEHFGPSDFERALRAQLHVAPYVVFSVPSVEWPHPEVGHERRLTTDEWRAALRACGCEPLYLDYYGQARWHVLAAVGRSESGG